MKPTALIALLLLIPGVLLAQEVVEDTPAAGQDVPMETEVTTTGEEVRPKETEESDDAASLEKLKIGYKSLFFTTIPLALGILVFMFLVNAREDRDKFAPFFGEGQFLKLVVVVMVAGNVCSLAIMGILEKSEISAIYGGIIGYVLGQSASKYKDSRTGTVTNDTPDPSGEPQPEE